MNIVKWYFIKLDNSIQKAQFDCGIPQLNDYLKKYALQNDKKGVAKVIVAIPVQGDRVVAGYYTISMSLIERESIPDKEAKRLPRYPLPAMLVGKLAVDKSRQGQKLGEELLINALDKALNLSEEVGIFAVRVDALDERAKSFYLKYGFQPFQDQPFSLFRVC
ncbi:MAG: GNAT family N-acetyltransferase [Symploca sp. SIO1C2]|nr:GNAT family N-acetyltransferase [Symploca sp. SIO1C2]